MRLRILLFLALLVSGCTIPTEPNYPEQYIGEITGYESSYLYRSPIPQGRYDGLFTSGWHKYDYLDSARIDTSIIYYSCQGRLYNKLGDYIGTWPDSLSVQLNGVGLSFQSDLGYYSGLQLNVPSSVLWALSGNSYFPSFSHSINSESPIDILSPLESDSLNEGALLDFIYNAPGADSVTVTIYYDGMGIYTSDTTQTLRSAEDDPRQELIANSGSFNIPPYVLKDTQDLKSFTPQSVDVAIAWAQADTIHVAGKVFGFVTEAVCSREYYFKQ